MWLADSIGLLIFMAIMGGIFINPAITLLICIAIAGVLFFHEKYEEKEIKKQNKKFLDDIANLRKYKNK